MEKENIKSKIIELCSEDAYGSWELWWSLGAKEGENRDILYDQFIQSVEDLINLGKILAFKKSEHDQFSVVPLDGERLKYELQNADHPVPLEFFWFDLENNEGRIAGTRYQYPDGRGVRVLPGIPGAPDIVRRRAYSRIIDVDKVSEPVPLKDNPAK